MKAPKKSYNHIISGGIIIGVLGAGGFVCARAAPTRSALYNIRLETQKILIYGRYFKKLNKMVRFMVILQYANSNVFYRNR